MIRYIKTIFLYFIEKLSTWIGCAFIYYNHPLKIKTYRLCASIKDDSRTLLSVHELYVLYQAAFASLKIKGELAEVGVYKGGSAKLLCILKGNKHIYLFDTFRGLPSTTKKDDSYHREGMYQEHMESVAEYLKMFKNVILQKGLFPRSASCIINKRFCFVHLDIDLYKGTLDALNFFWPRLNKGGIIFLHDYPVLMGVKNAVYKFCKQKNVSVIEIPPAQAVIIKI